MLRLYANTSEAFISRHQGFCTRTCASFSQGKKQQSGSPQHWLTLGRWRKSIKSMSVNVSGLKQQFPNSLCSGTIDMTAGVLWGLLQSCSSVDLPWDVWGSAGMALTGQSVCATTCARGGHCHLRNRSGKEASLSFCVLQPAFGLSVLTYSKSP